MTTHGPIYLMVEEEMLTTKIEDEVSEGIVLGLKFILPKIQELEPRWISVKDRLPNSQEWVWFYKIDGESCEGRLLESGDFEDVFGDGITPTYWQPLPLPPTK